MANRKHSFDELFTPEGAISLSPEGTALLGAAVAQALHVPSVISLEGPLGAGKTQMVKGIVSEAGCPATASSPTFAIMHEYPGGRFPIFHFDFYRLADASELLTCGFDDCLGEGITVIEWGNRLPEVLPIGTLRINIEVLPGESRRFRGAMIS